MAQDMLFETEHLIVRKFRVEDAKQLYENHMDEEVRKWFPNECYHCKTCGWQLSCNAAG